MNFFNFFWKLISVFASLLRHGKQFQDQEYEDQINVCHFYLDSFVNALEYLKNERKVMNETNDEFRNKIREILM